jgi:hypothetical protein
LKKGAIYILLLFYIAVQLKPLTAIMQDVLAHTFFKMSHIATVHYENGKYHLHTQLENINNEDGGIAKEKAPSSEKSNENTPNQIVHELNFDLASDSILIPEVINPDEDSISGYARINTPPPKPA